MTVTILLSLLPSLTLSTGDALMRCPVEDIQVIASATALDGEYVQGVLYWPILRSRVDTEALALMNKTMDYETVTGETLQETLETFTESERGIIGSTFNVNCQDAGLLDITITTESYGAYPSTFGYHFTFDIGTGERLFAEDLFKQEEMDDLVTLLDLYLQRNIEISKQQNSVYMGDDIQATRLDQNFVREDLDDFTVTPEGMIFRHHFGFPHAILALEPRSEIFLDWEALAEFIDTEGPLAAMVSWED